ncbi:SH3 domain-containing protein [Devosia sp. LjRoot3]|uniref:SH3 domain-containing protein n=1 Tax=Devosia sp. LjRoot3 TaxID=3342319 RepID=UPI003ED1111A
MIRTLVRFAMAVFAVLVLSLPALAQMFGPAVTVANVNLRNGPGTNHAVIRVVRSGEEVTIVRCERNWCLVNAGRDTGWLSQSYVMRLIAAPPPPMPWPDFDFDAGPARACFYDRPNFRGDSFCLRPGNGNANLGNWRNRIASVAIHGNSLSVDLCTGRDFRNCTSIRRDMSNLSRQLQGAIASVKVW